MYSIVLPLKSNEYWKPIYSTVAQMNFWTKRKDDYFAVSIYDYSIQWPRWQKIYKSERSY